MNDQRISEQEEKIRRKVTKLNKAIEKTKIEKQESE